MVRERGCSRREEGSVSSSSRRSSSRGERKFESRGNIPQTHLNRLNIQPLLPPIPFTLLHLKLNLHDLWTNPNVPRSPPHHQLVRRRSEPVVSKSIHERIVSEDDLGEEALSCSSQSVASPRSLRACGREEEGRESELDRLMIDGWIVPLSSEAKRNEKMKKKLTLLGRQL